MVFTVDTVLVKFTKLMERLEAVKRKANTFEGEILIETSEEEMMNHMFDMIERKIEKFEEELE